MAVGVRHNEKTGIGQFIDIALFDVVVMLTAGMNMVWLADGKVPQRSGNASPFIVPYSVFATKDGHVIAGVGSDAQWPRLCAALDIKGLGEDPRLASNAGRSTHSAEVLSAVAAAIGALTMQECVNRLRAAAVPVGPVNTIERVFADPQVRHRQLVVNLPHPVAGTLPLIRNPARLSETPVEYRAPPLVGQHSEEVLASLRVQAVDAVGMATDSGAASVAQK